MPNKCALVYYCNTVVSKICDTKPFWTEEYNNCGLKKFILMCL